MRLRRREPERQGIIVLANIRNELLRELTTRVKLSKVTNNSSPNKVVGATRVIFGRIKVKGVFERRYSFRNVASEFVKLLLKKRRIFVIVGLGL